MGLWFQQPAGYALSITPSLRPGCDESFHNFLGELDRDLATRLMTCSSRPILAGNDAKEVSERWRAGCAVVAFCAEAWRVFEGGPEDCPQWEEGAIARFLGSDLTA
jgi:hypothetical protein